jgi:hypothetical protein
MAWHDQFQVEDEKVDGRWLILAFAVVLLAVAGYYYLNDSGGALVVSDLRAWIAALTDGV